jgi:hypothetical protein
MNTLAIATHLNVLETAIVKIEEWANVIFVVAKGVGARFVSKKVNAEGKGKMIEIKQKYGECSDLLCLTKSSAAKNLESLQLLVGVMDNYNKGYYVEFELSKTGVPRLINCHQTNHLVNTYLHVDTAKEDTLPLTIEQVDTIMSWLEFQKEATKGKMYPDRKVELFPGWSLDLTAGATLQSVLQNTAYGNKKIHEFYNGVAVA